MENKKKVPNQPTSYKFSDYGPKELKCSTVATTWREIPHEPYNHIVG